MKKNLSFLLFILLFSGPGLLAQNAGLGAQTAEEMINIPPLKMLLDSAMQHSPLLKTKDIEISIREIQLKVQKWEWADYIRPFTEYRYGSIDNYVLLGGTLVGGQQSVAHRFSLGAQISLTVFDAINYRSKIKIADKMMELDISKRRELEQLITQEIIRLWNSLITFREIIFIKSEQINTQLLNEKEARLLYQSGEIPIVELARISVFATTAREEFELAKKEFREAIYILKDLVGRGDITSWIVN